MLDHHNAVIDLRNIGPFTHGAYPPLVSSTVGVVWLIAGNGADRAAQIVVSLVNGCAVLTAAWAVAEAGFIASRRLGGRWKPSAVSDVPPLTGRRANLQTWTTLPMSAGVIVAGLLIFTTFGIVEPFATNGYADPLWSAAAVGAVAFGLQLPPSRSAIGTAAILLAVAGETKVEGTVVAVVLVVLVTIRWVMGRRRVRDSFGRSLKALAVAGGGIAFLAAWPLLMLAMNTTAGLSSGSLHLSELSSRIDPIYEAMQKHLYVIPLTVIVAVAGALLLSRVRRVAGTGNDIWAWGALLAGLLVLAGAYLEGNGGLPSLDLWLRTSAHRTTEFPALMAWWITAEWIVVGCTGVAIAGIRRRARSGPPSSWDPQRSRPTVLAQGERHDEPARPGRSS